MDDELRQRQRDDELRPIDLIFNLPIEGGVLTLPCRTCGADLPIDLPVGA